ncbi:Ribosomal protein S18 acetylase RimI [Fictibacillus solisalsi]|uniref:Ribosomal protein S18 acetylase RimI n=1 Tax=Fictibacillus solisalsi TaxID=459525 RepID=A0A1G9ZZW5_9BACL|nr:GNAT family N-acetyltransferase [Fictibacillus solisalsi]SDN26848.1 Ribosomal protein S18 acetylase RimI [Fictibacillus solisalsi]
MQLTVKPSNEGHAREISHWSYEAPYDFYNMDGRRESMNELLENHYSVVLDEKDKLVGFFCTGKSAQVPAGKRVGAYEKEDELDIGLGMNPELTGQGNGSIFLPFILGYLEGQLSNRAYRLTMASFNQRAIRLYQKFGFREIMAFHREKVKFIVMVRAGKLNGRSSGRRLW